MYLPEFSSIYPAHLSSGLRPVHASLPLSSPSGLPDPTGHDERYAVFCAVPTSLSL